MVYLMTLSINNVFAENTSLTTLRDQADNVQNQGHNQYITLNVNGISLQLVMQPSQVASQTQFYLKDEGKQSSGWTPPIALQGKVTGDPDSWARLTQIDEGVYMGQIQAFGELYEAIPNSTDNPANNLHNDVQKTSLTTLPALSEQYRQLSNQFKSTKRKQNSLSGIDYLLYPPTRKTIDNLQSRNTISDLRAQTGVNVPKALRIGIVVDSLFNEFHDGMGVERAIALINVVDGIYQQELGAALLLESVIAYTNPQTDPIRDINGPIESKLAQFGNVRQLESGLSRDLTMVHLFSGAPDSAGVLGLGWIDTACRTDGFDVSLSTPFAFDALLAAHEMAHNLGAGHDDSNACRTNQSRLMWPRLSSRTQPTFSACSLDDIAPSLQAGCNLDNIDLSIALQTRITTNPNELALRVEIDNLDPTRPTDGARAVVTLPSANMLAAIPVNCRLADANDIGITLSQSETQLLCLTGNIPARSRAGFEIGIRPLLSPVQQFISADVAGLSSADTFSQNNRTLLNVGMAGVATGLNDSGSGSPINSMSAQNDSAAANAVSNNDNTIGLPMAANVSSGSMSVAGLLSLLTLILLRFAYHIPAQPRYV